MSQVIIDVGNNANDGTGDSLRVAAGKINTNFTDRYADDLFTTNDILFHQSTICLLYTSPSPRDRTRSRMPSSA